MTKQQELNELTQLIDASGIYEAIDHLKIVLETYQSHEIVSMNRYVVYQEFDNTKRKLRLLECELEDLMTQASAWEGQG